MVLDVFGGVRDYVRPSAVHKLQKNRLKLKCHLRGLRPVEDHTCHAAVDVRHSFFLFICLFQKIRFRCVNERHSFAAQRHSKRHSFFLFICQSPIYWFCCCWLRHSFRCLSPTIYLNYNPKIFYKVGKAQKRCRN